MHSHKRPVTGSSWSAPMQSHKRPVTASPCQSAEDLLRRILKLHKSSDHCAQLPIAHSEAHDLWVAQSNHPCKLAFRALVVLNWTISAGRSLVPRHARPIFPCCANAFANVFADVLSICRTCNNTCVPVMYCKKYVYLDRQ